MTTHYMMRGKIFTSPPKKLDYTFIYPVWKTWSG